MGNFFVAYERCAIDFEAPKVSRIGRAEQHVLIYNWSTGWKYSEVKGVPLNSVNWKKYVFLFCRLSIKSVGLLATYYARSTMSHFSIRVFELEHKIRLSKNFVALNLRKVWSGCDILRPVKRWQMEEELHERRNKRFLFNRSICSVWIFDPRFDVSMSETKIHFEELPTEPFTIEGGRSTFLSEMTIFDGRFPVT